MRGNAAASVGAEDADQDALDFDVFVDIDGIHGGIGGLQAHAAAFFEETFESGLAVVEQGDDDFTITGLLATFDDDVIAILNVVFDHGVALDAQDVGAVAGVEEGFEIEGFAIFDGFDGLAGGDGADDREAGGFGFVRQLHRRRDLQRASPVVRPQYKGLSLQSLDVLEDGDL